MWQIVTRQIVAAHLTLKIPDIKPINSYSINALKLKDAHLQYPSQEKTLFAIHH
jgi:hypothetical protein